MKWRDFDLAGAFAFVHAAAISAMSLELLLLNLDEFDLAWTMWYLGACVAAWGGFRAWRRKRWLLAAVFFFLALAWPGGFAVMITGPLVLGLMFVSLIRAWQDRPARRRRQAAGRGPR